MFLELRNIAAPQVPVPLQHVATVAYGDEAHVEENRRLYRIKFDLADQIIGNRYGYRRPAGGFCVWLDVVRASATTSPWLSSFSRKPACAWCPAAIWRGGSPMASIPAPATFAWRWCRTVRPRREALHRLVETLG